MIDTVFLSDHSPAKQSMLIDQLIRGLNNRGCTEYFHFNVHIGSPDAWPEAIAKAECSNILWAFPLPRTGHNLKLSLSKAIMSCVPPNRGLRLLVLFHGKQGMIGSDATPRSRDVQYLLMSFVIIACVRRTCAVHVQRN